MAKNPNHAPLTALQAAKGIERTPVNSSTIRSIGYDPKKRIMEVEFWGRGAAPTRAYRYGYVTQEEFDALKGAESIGSHFAQHIKGNADINFTEVKTFLALAGTPKSGR